MKRDYVPKPNLCKKGFQIGSKTGLSKCPKCEFKDSEEQDCKSSRACASASVVVNKAFGKMFR